MRSLPGCPFAQARERILACCDPQWQSRSDGQASVVEPPGRISRTGYERQIETRHAYPASDTQVISRRTTNAVKTMAPDIFPAMDWIQAGHRKLRRKLQCSACPPGWPDLDDLGWPAMASKAIPRHQS